MNTHDLDEFARYYGFHYDGIDAEALARSFCADMERGLRGEPSSLPMIPSHLFPVSAVPPGKTVIALDAGGTNLRVSRVLFDEEGRPKELATHRAAMPGTKGRVSAAEFFDELAAACVSCFEGPAPDGVGFCFSYAMEVTASGDGIPTTLSKEVDAPEIIGHSLGDGLRGALAKRGIAAPERVVFLNDTTATLLSGIAQIPPRRPDKTRDTSAPEKLKVEAGGVIGFILGTGLNTAYPETSIPKIGFESKDKPQIVVAESGGWSHPWQGKIDREFDASTKCPGQYTLEKASSGAYLGPLSLLILKRAVREKLLVFAQSAALLDLDKLETRSLNEFLHHPLALEGPLGGLFSPGEEDAIARTLYLESIITERAALLGAGLLAGTAKRMNAGRDPLRPLRIAVEGTTYLRYHHLRESLEARLYKMLCGKTPRFFVVAPVEQASLFGAAVAAVSQEES